MKLTLVLTAFLTVLLLTSCSTTGSGDFCTTYRPVYVGDGDVFTDQTAQQILRNNKKYKELCE